MKKKISNMFLAGAMLALMSPVGGMAAPRGGHFNGGGGHAFQSPRAFSGNAGRVIGPRGRPYYGGGYYRGRGYYGSGLYLGFGAPYAYGYAPAPPPCGFYDQAGYWHADPACYAGNVGY
jgi:hypothetical protein